MTMSARPAWIAVDWGTTHMRAYAMADNGEVLDRAHGPGMAALTTDPAARDANGLGAATGFEMALLAAIGPWLGAGVAGGREPFIIMCGMAGSRQGWQEAGYRQVPQDLSTLAEGLVAAKAHRRALHAFIVPGLSQLDPYDVMRGEETQLAGYLAMRRDGESAKVTSSLTQRVCLPGTHSKWAVIEHGRVTGFTTFLTGELFDILSTKSILTHSLCDDPMDRVAFRQAVRDTVSGKLSLSHALFSIRAEGLLAGENGSRAKGRLSGLLIGAELTEVDLAPGECVALIGAPGLCDLYAEALGAIGCQGDSHDGEAMVLRGLGAVHDDVRRRLDMAVGQPL